MAYCENLPLSEWLKKGVEIGRRDGAVDAPVLRGTGFENELYQSNCIRLSQGTLGQVYEAYRSAYSQARLEALPAKLITAVNALREDVARQQAELMALLGDRLSGSVSGAGSESAPSREN